LSARRKTLKNKENGILFMEERFAHCFLNYCMISEVSLISSGYFTEGRQRLRSTFDLIRAPQDSGRRIME